jgi:transposase
MVGAAEEAASKNGGVKVNAGGRPRTCLDLLLEAMFYRLRNAGPWRDLPERFGPWSTIHGWHSRWAREGLWRRLMEAFARRVRGRVRLVDGTHILVHQCAANPAGGAAAQAMGKTRGGRNTKLMALTNAKGRLVSAALIAGQAYEGHHVLKLIKQGCNLRIVGDKGFDDDKLRSSLRALGHHPCFPGKSNRKRKVCYSKKLYRTRFKVENFFCRLKRWGCTATRRDKLAQNFFSLIHFAAVIDWLKP